MGRVAWFREAREDLRATGDMIVIAQVLDLAERELDPTPVDSSIEGSVPDSLDVKWRRCVLRSERTDFESFEAADDDDEFTISPHDFVLMYRKLTPDERIDKKLTQDLLVLRVLSNVQLASLLDGAEHPARDRELVAAPTSPAPDQSADALPAAMEASPGGPPESTTRGSRRSVRQQGPPSEGS